MALFLICIYGCFLMFILFYSMVQLNLVLLYNKKKKNDAKKIPQKKLTVFPKVTVQLPIYNELYVVERLIDSIAKFDYPKDKLHIQILDDSDDETVEIIDRKVKEYKAKGFMIEQVRRKDRVGFKAGALQYGMDISDSEFLAIFDADFLPHEDFLLKTIPHFDEENIGVVQTKWFHINEDFSILTKLQAFGLDAHFSVEQAGRNFGEHFINFNGTAGVWRRKCIVDAGGWSSDTLTEDLDLSYRAQLKEWKFKFLENIGSPAELPAAMNALKGQQFRWTKGAAECARKNLGKVLFAKNISFNTKLHALFHLMNSFIFICVFFIGLLSIPLFYIKNNFSQYDYLFNIGGFFLLSTVFLIIFYWSSFSSNHGNKWKAFFDFLYLFPMFLAFSMGLSLHNAIAVFEGYIGKKSPFIRTPKFNVFKEDDQWKNNVYLTSTINWMTFLEGIMAAYFLSGIAMSYYYQNYAMLPFFILLAMGFIFVFYYSLSHSKGKATS